MQTEIINSQRQFALAKFLQDCQGHSAEVQRKRVLRALETGSLTTHEARSHLDVLAPAARVLELRRAGYPIQTVWVIQVTGAGKPHRIAKYILMSGAR